mmetsp:Transcript_14096/g.23940  ORF Transcript_14096/g.23940 Transcript_14096/m.23940 type:complete len:200 (+) Transcript_14096:219-818(+)
MVQDNKLDYGIWDVGGTNLFGGEQVGDKIYGSGNDFGVNLFLNNIQAQGVIWVVNINEDIENLLQSKMLLHETIFGCGQLSEVILILVFNRKPENKKATTNQQESNGELFNRDEIRQICSSWCECPFKEEQLKKFFNVDALSKRLKTFTFLVDANQQHEAKRVFQHMAETINTTQKEKKKKAEKQAQEAIKKQNTKAKQ